MVYDRMIHCTKGGKTYGPYGPYLYRSVRKGDTVHSVYMGRGSVSGSRERSVRNTEQSKTGKDINTRTTDNKTVKDKMQGKNGWSDATITRTGKYGDADYEYTKTDEKDFQIVGGDGKEKTVTVQRIHHEIKTTDDIAPQSSTNMAITKINGEAPKEKIRVIRIDTDELEVEGGGGKRQYVKRVGGKTPTQIDYDPEWSPGDDELDTSR